MGDAKHCDGCGDTRASVGRQLPIGWMRLNVWGRKGGDIYPSKLGVVEVCSAECGCDALKRYEEVL